LIKGNFTTSVSCCGNILFIGLHMINIFSYKQFVELTSWLSSKLKT